MFFDFFDWLSKDYYYKIFYISIFAIFVFTSTIFFSSVLSKKNNKFASIYDGVQKIHDGYVPRVGGLVIYLGCIIASIIFDNFDLKLICISSIFLLIVSLKEDLFHNVSPHTRLIAIFISAIILMFNFPYNFPTIHIPFLSLLFENHIFEILFFATSITILANGNNLIDGANGLSAASSLTSLFCLLFLSIDTKNYEFASTVSFYILLLTTFLIFNYPWGRIFLGDFGAYFNGFVVGYLTIQFFSINDNLPSWIAVLILFYPVYEVFFSYIRKSFFEKGKSPFAPDKNHLHLKIYFLLFNGQLGKRKITNCLVTPFLCVIWFMPSFLIPWTYLHIELVFVSIIFMMIIYNALYWATPRPKDD